MLEVGVREFRANLPHYLSAADKPVAITRHGQILGYFIPIKQRAVSEVQAAALREAALRMRNLVDELGIDEDTLVAEFDQARKAGRKSP